MNDTLDAIRRHMASAYGLDAQTIDMLVQSGVDSARLFWGQLCAAAGEPAGTAEAAHALKGTLRGLGLEAHGDLAEALEQAARHGRADDIPLLCRDLGALLKPLIG